MLFELRRSVVLQPSHELFPRHFAMVHGIQLQPNLVEFRFCRAMAGKETVDPYKFLWIYGIRAIKIKKSKHNMGAAFGIKRVP